jgi:hypothetical protein
MVDVPKFDDDVTVEEKYGPAMQINTEDDAKRYLEGCIAHTVRVNKEILEEDARQQELDNIGYYAGYFDEETRKRVEKLFGAVHPVFGSVKIKRTPKEIFDLGFEIGSCR